MVLKMQQWAANSRVTNLFAHFQEIKFIDGGGGVVSPPPQNHHSLNTLWMGDGLEEVCW